MGESFVSVYAPNKSAGGERLEQAQVLLQELALLRPGQGIPVQVHLVEDETVNAMALPGGHIILFTGLLDKLTSSEELAFVLSHEMGHFANRDHLRGVGRALILQSLVVLVTGAESSMANSLTVFFTGVEMKFSQHQELAADDYALHILHRRYGKVDGAAQFMVKLLQEEKQGVLAYYFATHPHPQERLRGIRKFARQNRME